MKCVAWVALFVVMGALCAGLFAIDLDLTDSFFYNGGYHRQCGGRWVRGDRAVTVNWCYCSSCGCGHTFRNEH